jgi:hypothetical protein
MNIVLAITGPKQKTGFRVPKKVLWLIKKIVFQINLCGQNSRLRQARNRYSQW